MAEFLCPITHEAMRDPVVAQDGHTYEREAIETWFGTQNTSPVTGLVVAKSLVPNYALRDVMEREGHELAPAPSSLISHGIWDNANDLEYLNERLRRNNAEMANMRFLLDKAMEALRIAHEQAFEQALEQEVQRSWLVRLLRYAFWRCIRRTT